MSPYWLCYRHNNSISVVIEPAHSLIYASDADDWATANAGRGKEVVG
jgi:hypothetical protein